MSLQRIISQLELLHVKAHQCIESDKNCFGQRSKHSAALSFSKRKALGKTLSDTVLCHNRLSEISKASVLGLVHFSSHKDVFRHSRSQKSKNVSGGKSPDAHFFGYSIFLLYFFTFIHPFHRIRETVNEGFAGITKF